MYYCKSISNPLPLKTSFLSISTITFLECLENNFKWQEERLEMVSSILQSLLEKTGYKVDSGFEPDPREAPPQPKMRRFTRVKKITKKKA